MQNEFDLTRLHTTDLGERRIRLYLGLSEDTDPAAYCRELILNGSEVVKQGKYHYFTAGNLRITVNSQSMTIITVRRIKRP